MYKPWTVRPICLINSPAHIRHTRTERSLLKDQRIWTEIRPNYKALIGQTKKKHWLYQLIMNRKICYGNNTKPFGCTYRLKYMNLIITDWINKKTIIDRPRHTRHCRLGSKVIYSDGCRLSQDARVRHRLDTSNMLWCPLVHESAQSLTNYTFHYCTSPCCAFMTVNCNFVFLLSWTSHTINYFYYIMQFIRLNIL